MKFMRLLSILLCTNLFLGIGFAQGQIIKHITPPNWWTGMNDPAVQLMIHGDNIAAYDVKINYPGVEVFAVSKVENPNY
nr:cyclomaltodextrinase N-terminal domain-containing protein [Chitinophagales bacterium]